MRFFSCLWQKVFMYALLLILATHIVSFAVFQLGIGNNLYIQMLEDLAHGGALALAGKGRDAVDVLPEFFIRSNRALWVEHPNGELVAGAPQPGYSPADRAGFAVSGVTASGVTLLETGRPEAPFLAAVPVSLQQDEAVLYLYMEKMPPPPRPVLFAQGLIAVCLIGGALSIWVAWRIARPLRRLRTEAMTIADGNLNARVSVAGSEEIAQVAEAVNSMAQSLSGYITSMRELVANISHEMRSPLARMTLSSAIIEEALQTLTSWYRKNPLPEKDMPPLVLGPDGEPLAVRHVDRLNREIEHMETLVGSCLLSSKLDLHQENMQMDFLDFSQLCRATLARYEAQWQGKGLSCVQDMQDDLWVEGDEALLLLILTNLLDNALKYTAQGGTVQVRMHERHGLIVLSVENSHPPVPGDILPHLFEPFYKNRANGAKTDGVGLGLSLVRKIAACHQGNIVAENGETGLRFTLWLPSTQVASAEFVQWFFERHGATTGPGGDA